MNYRLPTLEDYEILKEYVIEHYSNHERSISASLGMTNMKYEDWVEKVNRNSEKADDEWGRYYLYLAFDKDKLVGLLNIRYDLSDNLKELYERSRNSTEEVNKLKEERESIERSLIEYKKAV